MRYPCPCCGYLTFVEKPSGTFDICPVCYWEDDDVQHENPDFSGGANEVSLNQAKENFMRFSAIQEDFVDKVRPPFKCEIPKYGLMDS